MDQHHAVSRALPLQLHRLLHLFLRLRLLPHLLLHRLAARPQLRLPSVFLRRGWGGLLCRLAGLRGSWLAAGRGLLRLVHDFFALDDLDAVVGQEVELRVPVAVALLRFDFRQPLRSGERTS